LGVKPGMIDSTSGCGISVVTELMSAEGGTKMRGSAAESRKPSMPQLCEDNQNVSIEKLDSKGDSRVDVSELKEDSTVIM